MVETHNGLNAAQAYGQAAQRLFAGKGEWRWRRGGAGCRVSRGPKANGRSPEASHLTVWTVNTMRWKKTQMLMRHSAPYHTLLLQELRTCPYDLRPYAPNDASISIYISPGGRIDVNE